MPFGKWIDANDWIPGTGQVVLVCDQFNSFVTLGKIIEIKDKDGRLYAEFEMMGMDEIEPDSIVTHWMPLPLAVGENVNI